MTDLKLYRRNIKDRTITYYEIAPLIEAAKRVVESVHGHGCSYITYITRRKCDCGMPELKQALKELDE